MANYYTYGAVPDVDETVYGTSVNYAGLGNPEYADRGLPEEAPVGPSPLSLAEEPVPVDRPLLDEPYYGPSEEYNEPTTMPTRREAVPNLFVEGFTPGAEFKAGEGDYDAMQRVMASLSLMDPQALKGLSGTSFSDPNVAANAQFRADTRAGIGGGGSIYEEGALEAAKASAADPTKGIFSAGFQQLLAEDPEGTRAAIEAKSARDLAALSKVEADYAVMKPLSDLLKANRFQEAFALAKETGSLDKLMDTNVLRELRPAFSQQEMRDFFAAVPPEYAGGKYDFKPDVGVLESMDPFGTGNLAEAGYPDPTRAFKRKDDKTIENLAKVAAVAMLAAGLAPIATGGGGVGGVSSAGVTGTGATGVTGAGAVTAGGTAAAAPLAEVVITASKFGLTIPQAAALVSAGVTGTGALSSGAGAPATAATTPTQPPLEEVVVTGNRAIDPALLRLVPGSLASANLIQGMTDIPTDIYGQVEGQPDLTEGKLEATEAQQPQEPFKDRLAEVIVTGSKYKPGLLDIAKIGTSGLTAAEILKGFTEPTVRPYEKVTPEGEAPTEEVVVTGTRPPPIDLTKVGLGALTGAQLMQGFTQPKVDPLTGEPKEPPKTEQELDKIQEALKTGAPIPETGGALDRLKGLLEEYGTLENALKALGALGSAFSGTKGATTPTAGVGTGGMGGALPKYTYTRQQLSPDIDYYTYGTRPEAKFFDYNAQLEKPVQPELPPAKLPEEDKPMATGGLTGYAHGGSSESRYFEGPGSGRDDKIPALLSDGEYVMDAETLALLGDGSTKEGAKRMDQFRAKIRQHKGSALSRGRISPNAKSPDKYMGGGLS